MKKFLTIFTSLLLFNFVYSNSLEFTSTEIQANETSQILKCNQSIEIPKGSKHRLANPGEHPLVIVEVQIGDNLDEGDIIRYEDEYGRAPSK